MAFVSLAKPGNGIRSEGFIQVCTGPKPYSEAIREFVIASMAAYKKGYSVTALQFEMTAEQERKLEGDEVELRTVLITLVYKTLQRLNIQQEPGTTPLEVVPGPFDSFIDQIYEAYNRGFDLNRIYQQMNLTNTQEQARSPTESAILRQGSRVIYESILLAQASAGSS